MAMEGLCMNDYEYLYVVQTKRRKWKTKGKTSSR
jgi:hypothetical protein